MQPVLQQAPVIPAKMLTGTSFHLMLCGAMIAMTLVLTEIGASHHGSVASGHPNADDGLFCQTECHRESTTHIPDTIEKYHCEDTAEHWAPLFNICCGCWSKHTLFDLFQSNLKGVAQLRPDPYHTCVYVAAVPL